jgi:aminocarboxymuconate-semialdehyde decarboxylase
VKVDIHCHYVPNKAIERLEKDPSSYGVRLAQAVTGGRCLCFDYGVRVRPFSLFPNLLDLDRRVGEMDRIGIDRQVISVWTDAFGYGLPPSLAGRWIRTINDSLFEEIQRHPGRLSAMAAVPLQDADLAARELEYGVKELGARGVVIGANLMGTNLGDAPLDSFWAAAVEMDVPVFIHPDEPIAPPRAAKYNMNPLVHYTYDTTITVGSLIFGGVLDRFPGLNLILSHGGGYFPYQAGRFDRIYRNMTAEEAPGQPPSHYLRRFHYDTILHYAPALRYLRDRVGSDRLLLGSDYPFPPADLDPLGSLKDAEFSAAEIDEVGGGNAVRLFKLK